MIPDVIAEWLLGKDTGLSSKAIVAHLEDLRIKDNYHSKAHPLDSDDLGRCIRLLNLYPPYRHNLFQLKTLSPKWSILVDHWDELEALYMEDCPNHRGYSIRCANRMLELLYPSKDHHIVIDEAAKLNGDQLKALTEFMATHRNTMGIKGSVRK